MAARRPASILHTSDCHLDRLDGGVAQRAFAGAIDASIGLDVDLLLITGDLFDHARVPDDVLEWTGAELDRAGRPVVLLTGNHDQLDERSVHHRFTAADRCAEVTFVDDADGMVVHVPGAGITVWAKAMLDHHPGFRPLQGAPARPDDGWYVVAGHGLTVGRTESRRSSPIPDDDIDAIDADYIALGHVHVHQVVREHPLSAYAGSTANSLGGEPGVVHVELTPDEPSRLRWIHLDVTPTEGFRI